MPKIRNIKHYVGLGSVFVDEKNFLFHVTFTLLFWNILKSERVTKGECEGRVSAFYFSF